MLTWIAAMVGGTLLGGCVPLVAGRSIRLLHLLVACATGLFLGLVFLHILPEAFETGARGAGASGTWTGLGVLGGALLLHLVQGLVLPGRGADPHVRIGWGFLVGLSLHAFATGLGLAPTAPGAGGGVPGTLYATFLPHKAAEGFSLASVLLLAGARRSRVLALVGAFALVTPTGYWLGSHVLSGLSPAGRALFASLAAGTFLYVALTDLLPELLHEKGDLRWRLALLAAGIAAVALLGHGEAHAPDATTPAGEPERAPS